MPEYQQPPEIQPIDLDTLPFIWGDDPLGARQAKSLVLDTFISMESWRQRQERKWVEAEQLYWGYVPTRYWEGSKIERSSIPNNIAMDHVEGAHAAITSALFDNPEWFSVEAMDQVDPRDARELQAGLQYFLDRPDPQTYTTAISEIGQSIHTAMKYGSGFAKLEWKNDYPCVRYLNNYDVYPDGGGSSAFVDTWRFAFLRNPDVTVEQINNLRRDSRVKIPSDAVLNALRMGAPIPTESDYYKVYSDNLRGIGPYGAEQIPIAMPSANKLEIIEYYDRDRIIWLLNRKLPIYIGENPYKFLPIVHVPCRIIPGRIYGFGLPEAVKHPQRYSEAFLNNHIDIKHLRINAPMAMNKNIQNDSDRYLRPGQRWSTNSKDDIQIFPPAGNEENIWADIGYLESNAAKRNGFNDLSLSGNASRPGSVRTAAGVNAQMQGSNSRQKMIVTYIEQCGLAPLLYKIQKMVRYHTMPSDMLVGAYPSSDGRTQYRPIRAAVFHQDVRFLIQTASKMLTRDRLGQLTEFTGRMLINGPVMSELQKQQKKLNIDEFAQMVQDAGGLPKRYQLVVQMTQEEIEASKQPSPEAQAQMQKNQTDAQLKQQSMSLDWQKAQLGSQTEITKAQIAKQTDPMEAQLKQQEAQQKAQTAQTLAAIKIQTEEQKARMDVAKSQADLGMKQQEMDLKRQDMQSQREQSIMNHIMQMNQNQQKHGQEMQMMRERQVVQATGPKPQNQEPRPQK